MPWREDNQVLIRQSAVYLMHLLCRHKSGVFENSGFRRDCSKVISVDFMKGSKTERWLLTLYTVTHICAHDTAQAHSTVLEIGSAKNWFDILYIIYSEYDLRSCSVICFIGLQGERKKFALKWTGPNFERKKRTMKTFKIISHLSIIRMIY